MKPHSDDAVDEHTTDRLVIRRFRAEDAATLAAYRSDPAAARYQSWEGGVAGFVGSNGAGKSTTIRMLLGPEALEYRDVGCPFSATVTC